MPERQRDNDDGTLDGDAPAEREPRTVRLVAPNVGTTQRNRDWATTSAAPAGSIKTHYAVLEKIGDGGMGVVYLARDQKLGRHVAIKRLNAASIANASLKSRFLREARAVAALNHSGIVHIYGLGEDEEGPYIVMEYVAGPTEASPNKVPPMPFSLADRVHRDGPLSVSDALDLMLKICDAVSYAHSCRVIHRDLKPSNVLLNGNYEPRIVDFGLALKMTPDTQRLTLPGERMLSLGYGAPEQEADATVTDERADVYGLGALLFFSITGQNPRYFRESDIPEGLRMPIAKALEPDRERRWLSVRDFAAALNLVKAPSTIEVPTVKSTWRCKWCDTVNPVMIRYCGKCGWDGGEVCSECGSEIRIGIQFCGVCGADSREYEIATSLEDRIRKYWDDKSYELIIQQCGQISGFKPCGENGRRMVERIHHYGEDARRALARRMKLKDLIPNEIAVRNYEQAERHINEYETLSNDSLFSGQKKQLASLRVERDLDRAREAAARRDWAFAERIVEDLTDAAPADPRVRRIAASIRLRRTVRVSAVSAFAVLALYLLSAPPAFRIFSPVTPRLFKAVYGFAIALREPAPLRPAFDSYAALWEAADMYSRPDAPAGNPAEAPPPLPPEAGHTELLAQARADFTRAADSVVSEFRRAEQEWPEAYLADLAKRQQDMQKKGDFDGWAAFTEEMERFRADRFIPDPAAAGETGMLYPSHPQLDQLRVEFRAQATRRVEERKRRVVQIANAYLKQLADLQKDFTKRGLMDAAVAVNNEMKRIRALPEMAPEPDPTAQPANDPTPAPSRPM
ncbi:MAG: hypothetical protein FJ224_00670 [Lentisphaerae bacterium]|nr:hypothetical protein [Lentisphaerota bacterium]